MSADDADRYVQRCTHPKVRGSVRELLRIIARHIPTGYTTTPPIPVADLAVEARQHERTTRHNLKVLTTARMIRIVEGGRGNVARYELLHLDGVRPAAAVPLPLRADLREAKRSRKTSGVSPDLFDQTSGVSPDVWAYTVGRFTRRWRSIVTNVGSLFVNVGRNTRRWLQKANGSRKTSGETPDVALPLDVYVHTIKNVHTHTARPRENTPTEIPAHAPPPRHPWHAWCDGLVHVPKLLHDEFVRGQQRAGETIADVDTRLRAWYAQRGSPPAPTTDRDEFAYWRRVYAEDFAPPSARAEDRAPPPAGALRFTGREIAEAKRLLAEVYNGCPHDPRCASYGACVEEVAWYRRTGGARKSG